ncbi:hypothetical protein SHI21_13315 [Bacteriovorax sp. PP10]|uniref:Uncharacterized protein n=1 Tax=Bacteriovorax antarcticus TaxID=3088717 RepID=A0ABU5VVW1_9BACT|nr:hypothetical protein [Bacteriovorax sp. PP10]MEA9357198.1 hypothetical protein [Bacteriovorax sp. PP10]
MVGFRVSVVTFVFCCALFSPMGFAKSVNLKTIKVNLPTDFGTLQTEIHFDDRDLDVAMKVKKIVEQDLIKVINYFKYVPRNTVHFNVDPYLRLTNGNATPFPTNTINLYNFPASNSDHLIIMQDWLRGLVFHEFTHITHLDQTRGYLEVGRQIFGSIAKIPAGITPRWFTEGIAVWSESHLIDGGRLNNPLFRKELLIQFLRKEYCETIDCLDEPGVYPGGQLAYWAGSHFIEYVENKKPGAVKCLVHDNAGNVPFFLNQSFKLCTGNNAQAMFTEFRENFIKDQPVETAESEAWGDKISNAFGSDDLQKGIYLDGNTLFKVEKERLSEALVSYDLKENVNMMIAKYQYPIADISGITTVPNADIEQTDQGKFLIVSFNEDPRYRTQNRVWKLINTETLLIEATLPFKNDPSYVIGLGNNRYLTASFINNKWIIEKQRIDMGAKSVSDSEVVRYFGFDVNLTYFKKEGQKIYIKLNRGDLGNALYVSDLTLENFYKIYESKNYFDFPAINENFVVVRDLKELKLIEISEDMKKMTTSDIAKGVMDRVTFSEITTDRILVLDTRLKTKEMGLPEIMAYLKRNVGKPVTSNIITANFQDVVAPDTLANTDAENFPQFRHMLPHYWFFATGSNENISSFGAMTTFSDPMNLNVLNATALIYPSESKVGGNLDFLHKFSSVSDLWTANAFFNKEYSKTDFNEKISEKTEASIGTQYAFLLKRWTVMPGVYLGTTKTNDFISNRTVDTVGVSTVVTYGAESFDDFFQSLTLQTKFQQDNPDVGDSFLNTQTRIAAEGRFHERLVGGIKSSYGKLVKSGFAGGVLYGGGSSDISNTRWHEFYGIPYSNAYGNEIFTFRAYIDWNFWYIYRGSGFAPFFLKEAHLLLGRELMSADRIWLGGKRYDNKTVHSFFVGPVLKTNLFYYVPTDIEFIFSTIKRPTGNGSVNQFEVNIKANVF